MEGPRLTVLQMKKTPRQPFQMGKEVKVKKVSIKRDSPRARSERSSHHTGFRPWLPSRRHPGACRDAGGRTAWLHLGPQSAPGFPWLRAPGCPTWRLPLASAMTEWETLEIVVCQETQVVYIGCYSSRGILMFFIFGFCLFIRFVKDCLILGFSKYSYLGCLGSSIDLRI